jgi:hypothetical protein
MSSCDPDQASQEQFQEWAIRYLKQHKGQYFTASVDAKDAIESIVKWMFSDLDSASMEIKKYNEAVKSICYLASEFNLFVPKQAEELWTKITDEEMKNESK